MRNLALAAVVLSAMGFSRAAYALDGYQDRRGLYSALTVGGGVAMVDDTNEVGFHVGARVGGGLSQRATADLAFDFGNIFEREIKTFGFFIAGNFFPIEHVFARGGAGVSLLYPDMGDNQAGLSLIFGAGVEAFFAADLAGSFALTYQPDFYGDDFGTVHNVLGTLAISWY